MAGIELNVAMASFAPPSVLRSEWLGDDFRFDRAKTLCWWVMGVSEGVGLGVGENGRDVVRDRPFGRTVDC